MAGEFNAYARLNTAQHADENVPILHFVAKRNESALNCPRVELFQPNCSDSGCHDCLNDFIHVDAFYEDAILGVVAQNVLTQLPNTAETYTLSKNYGHVPFDRLDRNRIGPNKSKYLQMYYFILYEMLLKRYFHVLTLIAFECN